MLKEEGKSKKKLYKEKDQTNGKEMLLIRRKI